MANKQQEEKFNAAYQELNAQQQIAVDTIEGPVMVIAGPGTGKTQILSARIGKILLETDTQPDNILCLTYTDAGVVAMRKRLFNFIGSDAYKVNIYTFHAFCNDIIQENLSLFKKNLLEPISDLESIDLFRELIDQFPKNHPLKKYRGEVYSDIPNLKKLFSTMKREGWTPAFISSKIEEYIKSLPERDGFIAKRAVKEFKKGDVRTDKIAEEKEKMEKLLAAVNEFEPFQKLMDRNNRYDFDDMINWVIQAFEENEYFLLQYQERFLYILVDEYQDTSGTQNKLVELLASYWDIPNVFVVGDDDQSIYRFQGANMENMEHFRKGYEKDLLTIVLTQNYRSTQPILDTAKTIIDKNEARLVNTIEGLNKDLLSANARFKNILPVPPVLKEYETVHHEMLDIVLQVTHLLQNGVTPGKIGIIYKENKYGEDLTRYFNLKGLTVFSKRNLNILDIPLAKKIILLFNYLTAELDIPYGGDEMLFEILHFDWFGIPSIEIAKLSVEAASRKYKEPGISIRLLLQQTIGSKPKDLFSPGPHPALQKAALILEKLIGDVPNMTIQTLFETIIREAGILTMIMQHADKLWLLEVLTGIFDFIKEETRRNPSMNLQDLVNNLELMRKEKISLPLIKVSGNEKSVNLLTAHGSKGLEFEYVFLVGCNAQFWEKKKKPGSGYNFPDTLFSTSMETGDTSELRRLFYVALTRAEQFLQISFTRFKNNGREIEPSMFIAEIIEQHGLVIQKAIIDPSELENFAVLQFSEGLSPEIEKAEADFIDRILDKFVMNVTALNNYLKCPLQFYYSNLIRVPAGKSEATEFGSAVHYALEQLFRHMQENNDQFPPKQDFISYFEWYMQRHRENFTKEQYIRRLEQGQEVLDQYYDKNINSFNKVVAVERNIRNVVVNQVPLKGKLDKIEFEGKQVNVVDYKTGDIDKAKDKLKPPSTKNPVGGDYWRQAVFYKILIDNYEQKDWKVISTEFDFVEPDKKKLYRKEKIIISPEDISTVTDQISSTWQKIQQKEFYTGCGKPECHWCNFVKTHEIAVELHEMQDHEDE